MEKPVLSDPEIFPSGEILSAQLGKASSSFASLFEYNHASFPDATERWRYYNDGKQWLLNVSRKKKTLFWLSVYEGFFRTTFYFGSKFARTILQSKLPVSLKSQFRKSAGKKFRPITAVIRTQRDLGAYKKLLALKMSMK